MIAFTSRLFNSIHFAANQDKLYLQTVIAQWEKEINLWIGNTMQHTKKVGMGIGVLS